MRKPARRRDRRPEDRREAHGRRGVQTPELIPGATAKPPGAVAVSAVPAKPPTPLAIALARGFRWQEMIETGAAKSNSDLARKLRLDQSYIARTIRLASLAPDIIEAILDGQEPDGLSLWGLRRDVPLLWKEQRRLLGMEGK
jgi:hypothetical protein